MSTLGKKRRRDLRRRKWQFLAVLMTITLGVMLFAASFDSFRNLKASYTKTYDDLDFADLTITGGDTASIAREVDKIEGVAAVETRIQVDNPIRVDGTEVLGRIIGMPTDGQPSVDKVKILEGSYLSSSDDSGVLVEKHFADYWDLDPGSTLEVLLEQGQDVSFQQVTVLGVVASAEYIWPARSRQDVLTTPDDFGVLFVPQKMAESGGGSPVDQVLVLYDAEADTDRLTDEITKQANAAGADVQTQAEQPSNATLQEDVQGFGQLSYLFPILFLTAAGLATFVLLNRIVYSERAQIGTLLANGLDRRTVRRHYLGYGLIVGVTGAVLGVALGMVAGSLITGAYTRAVSVPDTVVRLYWMTPLVGLAFGVLVGWLSAVAPAHGAFHVSPAEAMRGEVPSERGKASILERVIPPLRHTPVRWRMTFRGIERSKRRSLSTVLGVVLSLVLILASWGMLDTAQILLHRQFDVIMKEDAQVWFDTLVTDAVVEDVAGVEGVATAEASSLLQVGVVNDNSSYTTELESFARGTEMHEFYAPGGDRIDLPSEGILVGEPMKDLIGVDEGDVVTLSFPTLEALVKQLLADVAPDLSVKIQSRTTVAGFVDEPLGTLAYVSNDELQSILDDAIKSALESTPSGDSLVGLLLQRLEKSQSDVDKLSEFVMELPNVSAVLVRYAEGANEGDMQTRLTGLHGVAAFVDVQGLFDTMQSALGLFYIFIGVMLVFGGIMAFALMFNTMSVNIAERSTELATMRASGVTAGQVARLITGENLQLTLLGIAPGLVVGWLVSSWFMSSFSSDLFSFSLQMRWTTFLYASLAIVATALIAQAPGLRAMRRFDIAKVVRERSQ